MLFGQERAGFGGLKRAGVPRVRVTMLARMAILYIDGTVVDRSIINPTVIRTIDRLGSGATDPTATAFRTNSGGGIGTKQVPGFLKSGVFGFGAVRGEQDFGLPSENARTMGFGNLGGPPKIKFPTLSRQGTSRQGWGTRRRLGARGTSAGAASGGEGNDVPDLDGNDVGGDEVEHAFAVRDSVGVDVTFVGAGGVVAASGFDLHAQEISVVLDSDVVGRGVSPRTDDGEALLGGAGHEQKLGPLAALLEVFGNVG